MKIVINKVYEVEGSPKYLAQIYINQSTNLSPDEFMSLDSIEATDLELEDFYNEVDRHFQ